MVPPLAAGTAQRSWPAARGQIVAARQPPRTGPLVLSGSALAATSAALEAETPEALKPLTDPGLEALIAGLVEDAAGEVVWQVHLVDVGIVVVVRVEVALPPALLAGEAPMR